MSFSRFSNECLQNHIENVGYVYCFQDSVDNAKLFSGPYFYGGEI